MAKRVRNRNLEYIPTERQALYHSSVADELMYGGAAGGGKSTATVIEAGLLCLENPGINVYLFRRTYPELETSLITEAQKWWTGIGTYGRAAHEWSFPNGSKMLFRHCRWESDRYLYQGAQINALFIDEITHFSLQTVEYLKTRVRAEKSLNFRPRCRFTGNPGGIGHAWVKELFIDLEPEKIKEIVVHSEKLNKDKIIRRQYIPAKVTDNPHIGEEYVFNLEQKPEAMRRALLDGDWNLFEGQVFYEFRDDAGHYADGIGTHVIQPFEIPPSWQRYRSYDFGYSKPFSVLWWAQDPDGRLYLYREWYGASAPNTGIKMPISEQAEGMKTREVNDGQIIGWADPSIWDAQMGDSVAEQMARAGVYFSPGDNHRIAGKMELHDRLRFGEDGRPMLYVFSTCREFIRTIPSLVYSQIRVEDVDTTCEDHAYDAARYMLMAVPLRRHDLRKADRYDTTPDYDNQIRQLISFGKG